MSNKHIPTAEECFDILGFYPKSKKFKVEHFSDHPEGLYKLTPRRAQFILDFLNENNRKPKSLQVKCIEGSITKNGWQNDGDTLRFSTDGNIPEWQHRLKAIVAKNRTVYIAVVTGCDLNPFTKTAGARPRRPVDEIQRVYNNDSKLRSVSSDEVTTLGTLLAKRKHTKKGALTMQNAIDKWKLWEEWVIDGEKISKKFFKEVDSYGSWRRIIAAWAALMSFTGKRDYAIKLLNILKEEELGTDSKPLTKGLIKFQEDVPEAKWSNNDRSDFVWYTLCYASDRIMQREDGRIQFELKGSQANHDTMKKKGGVYREFLEDPNNYGTLSGFLDD